MSAVFFSKTTEVIGETTEDEEPVSKPIRGILKNAVSPKEQKIVIDKEIPGKRAKRGLCECPVNWRGDPENSKKFKNILLYGTDLEKIISERDKKVSICCLNLSAELITATVGWLTVLGLLILAATHAHEQVRYYELIPWVLAFLLAVSIIIPKWIKVGKLLVPYRWACALARLIAIMIPLLGAIYIVVFLLLAPKTRILSTDTYLTSAKEGLLLIFAGVLAYPILGVIASAATRYYLSLENQQN